MKFKSLSLVFGIFITSTNVYATCGTASGTGTDYTVGSNTNTSCAPTIGTTSVTVNSGITLNGGNSEAGVFINTLEVLTTLNNSGTITSSNSNAGVYVGNLSGGSITTLNNYSTGIISNSLYGIIVDWPASSIGTINNQNLITGGWAGIDNFGVVNAINNSGTFSQTTVGGGYGSAINNHEYIGTITNQASGVITGPNGAITNDSSRTIGIQSIINLGTIVSSNSYGITNSGGIASLSNSQGAGNANGALTYTGNLPSAYNIIITNSGNFGKLAVTSAAGNTVFGISPLSARGSSAVGNYSSIITGVTNTALGVTGTSLMGATSNGYTYNLIETGSGTNIWDLSILSAPLPIPTGPSAADTQASLQNTAAALHSTYALQNSVVANSLNYDCQVFDKNNICVSAGGRNTNVQAGGVNNVSALLIAAYRAIPEVRLGAYLDQNLSVTANNSPVNLGVNSPLFGLFAVWNENQDGTGTEVKVSGAYGQKNTTITRAVVGTSEAGTGSSTLSNSGVQAIAKYGFGLTRDAVVSPYVGIRYSQGNMGGYTEATSAAVTTPLTYSALNTNATTFMAGVHGKYKLTPEATVQASVGLESDMAVNNGSLTATGITGLTPVNFNPNPVKTRPVAMLGAYYDVQKNQRVAVTGIYRQEPYQAIGSTTALATYTVGF